MLTLWRRRGEATAVAETTSQLQSMLTDPAALDAIEFYLPQFAHMLIQLGGASGDTWCRRSACAAGPPRCTLAAAKACLGSLPDAHPGDVIDGSAELEKFVLAASQMSVHFAMQFFWIVYASLQEHRPKKPGSNRGAARRRQSRRAAGCHGRRAGAAGRGACARSVPGAGWPRGAGLAAPSMLWRCGWPAARAWRQLRTVEPVKAPLQRRSRWARGQEGGMRTPRAGPMGCCCRYTPALSTRATNVASSGGSSGSECRGGGARMQGVRGVGWGAKSESGRTPQIWVAPRP